MALVYIHKRKDNDSVFYVGVGKTERRVNSKDSRNNHWKGIVNKYGYYTEVTHRDIIWEEALSIEKYLIDFYGRKDLGKGKLVNKTDGGEGFINFSEETLRIIREKNIGRKHSPETIKKLSNRPRTAEHIEKLRISHTGKKLSEEAKEKVRQFQKNKIVSDETKKRLSEARKQWWIKKKAINE
ncbi:Nuclease associated modular domain 3 [uncultured Caudovirales phage]|uniref:Nuclease associated modular domain 3 n=1 Tax=uncultured Caudovirales phage TaxID=2100421 RepID=A0A6J5LTL7_9CAUD|nr:Nuclease associated modular domain 3 [uncultured Caudovirales phage]